MHENKHSIKPAQVVYRKPLLKDLVRPATTPRLVNHPNLVVFLHISQLDCLCFFFFIFIFFIIFYFLYAPPPYDLYLYSLAFSFLYFVGAGEMSHRRQLVRFQIDTDMMCLFIGLIDASWKTRFFITKGRRRMMYLDFCIPSIRVFATRTSACVTLYFIS